jgi:hypothetical protein
MLVLQEQIPAHAGETFAKHPRFPRPLTWRILKAKTFETINTVLRDMTQKFKIN